MKGRKRNKEERKKTCLEKDRECKFGGKGIEKDNNRGN